MAGSARVRKRVALRSGKWGGEGRSRSRGRSPLRVAAESPRGSEETPESKGSTAPLAAAAGLSLAGTAETAWLALSRGAPLCASSGACASAYGSSSALPTAGCIAYIASTAACAAAARSGQLARKAVAVAIGGSLMTSSAYFITVLDGYRCPYCLASGFIAASVFACAVSSLGEMEREDGLGPGFASCVVTLLAVNAVVAPSVQQAPGTQTHQKQLSSEAEQQMIERIVQQQNNGELQQVQSSSSDGQVQALANHLQQIGAKMYAAHWCTHCKSQLDAFGSAASSVPYVECFPGGGNAIDSSCEAAGVRGFPTWVINGEVYEGERSLEELARVSGFQMSAT